jgi:hypothetical protein
MLDAPQQNWQLYESMSRAVDVAWLRGLTAGDRFTLYADLFNLVAAGRVGLPSSERLDSMRWREKVEARARLVDAFARLDQWRRERASTNHAG